MDRKEVVFVYRIDKDDVIRWVSENWASFAAANGWAGGSHREGVMGRLIWNFIAGIETQHLYREVFRRVRGGREVGPIPFRCDSPAERRFLELALAPQPEDRIELTSTILRTESRDPVRLLDREQPRSRELLRICSMCKKILIAGDEWVEIEEALTRSRVFEADEMPALSHSLCPACYAVAMDDADSL